MFFSRKNKLKIDQAPILDHIKIKELMNQYWHAFSYASSAINAHCLCELSFLLSQLQF